VGRVVRDGRVIDGRRTPAGPAADVYRRQGVVSAGALAGGCRGARLRGAAAWGAGCRHGWPEPGRLAGWPGWPGNALTPCGAVGWIVVRVVWAAGREDERDKQESGAEERRGPGSAAPGGPARV